MIATYTETTQTTPSKARQEVNTGTPLGSLDSSARSFPHIPDDVERDSSRATRVTTTSTRYTSSSSSRSGMEPRQVGDEDMFHQKVS